MSVTVEISNPANLQRVKSLLGAKTDEEAMDMALEKVIEVCEPVKQKPQSGDLPDEYWEDLFSDPPLPAGRTIQAVLDDRNEERY